MDAVEGPRKVSDGHHLFSQVLADLTGVLDLPDNSFRLHMATALFLLATHALLGGSLGGGLAAASSAPPPPLPLPSAPQLWYSQGEIMALLHFNMASFVEDGDPGCTVDNWLVKKPYAAGKSSDPATFNPKK